MGDLTDLERKIKDKLSLKNGRELVQHAIQWVMNERVA